MHNSKPYCLYYILSNYRIWAVANLLTKAVLEG